MTTILWRRLDQPGHEYCSLENNRIAGVALFAHEGQPWRLDYSIECDPSWRTIAARVTGSDVDISIRALNGSWTLNGTAHPNVKGCIDVDLNFSPSTNLLPIRRLNLAVGQRAEVSAAWLRFPSFTLERLDQSYTRTSERTYRYESRGGEFVADIVVNDEGLPLSYGNLWTSS